MNDPTNQPAPQRNRNVLQRIWNVLSAASRVKLFRTAIFITLMSTAGLAWANHPVCGRAFDLMNKIVDLTDQFHLMYGNDGLKIDFSARPGSAEHRAGNRDP